MVGWEHGGWRGWRRGGEITYVFRLLPARTEGWYQGQGCLPHRCPSEKVLRGNLWGKVLTVLVRTSEGYGWVAEKWWETITMIAPSRRT